MEKDAKAAESTVKLRLINLSTYSGPRVGQKILKTGDTFDFTEAAADAVLQLFAVDPSGGQHPYFERVDADDDKAAQGTRVVTRARMRHAVQ